MRLDAQAPIRTIMVSTVVSLTPSHRVREAHGLFASCGLHHLPVIDEDRRLLGIVSHTDLYRVGLDPTFPEDGARLTARDGGGQAVASIMRTEPITVGPDDPIELAVAIFAEGAFHALPVVDGEERLVGIVTTSDILRRLRASG